MQKLLVFSLNHYWHMSMVRGQPTSDATYPVFGVAEGVYMLQAGSDQSWQNFKIRYSLRDGDVFFFFTLKIQTVTFCVLDFFEDEKRQCFLHFLSISYE